MIKILIEYLCYFIAGFCFFAIQFWPIDESSATWGWILASFGLGCIIFFVIGRFIHYNYTRL